MHRDMFKIQDGVAIAEKLNCSFNSNVTHSGHASRLQILYMHMLFILHYIYMM